MSLEAKMLDRLNSGLLRRAANSCSRWACQYRIIKGKPWTFERHPWLREMHDSKATYNTGKKAAQMGYTETVLNIAFFNIDVLRYDVLYVLPNKTPDASDFSSARFDPALEESEHLRKLFSETKNVGHKRAGNTNLYVRGSRGRSGLKSVPANLLVFDERDEMAQKQVTLGLERASGQENKQVWQISTPSLPDFGIDTEFEKSTKEQFSFRCPGCNRHIMLSLENLVVTATSVTDPALYDSYIRCTHCGKKLPEGVAKAKMLTETGVWVPDGPKIDHRGFHINQLYSTVLPPWEIAQHVILSKSDESYEQELYNSKLGLAHAVKGAKIDDGIFNSCIRDFTLKDCAKAQYNNTLTTMGVDVGTKLHVVILEWMVEEEGGDLNTMSRAKVIYAEPLDTFEEVDRLMYDYQINFCIVDMNPETRLAKQFADRFPGYIRLCYYSTGCTGRSLVVPRDEDKRVIDWRINAARTSWLDTCLGRFHKNTIDLPLDISQEFKDHITIMTRKPGRDKYDNPTVTYVKPENKGDHFAHALNYAEIALPLAVSRATGRNIGNIL